MLFGNKAFSLKIPDRSFSVTLDFQFLLCCNSKNWLNMLFSLRLLFNKNVSFSVLFPKHEIAYSVVVFAKPMAYYIQTIIKLYLIVSRLSPKV